MAEGQLVDKELQENRKRIEQLEKEKQELSEKAKGLGDIIESLSAGKQDPEVIESRITTQLKDIGEKFDAKLKRLEDTSGNKDEMKKQMASLMKEKVDPKLTEISDKLKDVEKIRDLADKITQINDRLSNPIYQPKQPGAVSQGLASFGEQIDFESEINDVKKTLDNVNQGLLNMSKRVEYRLTSAEDKLKELDKLKHLEDAYREINDKIGAENVQKLKKIIFSSDELIEEVIPETVSRKLKKRVEPIVNSLKANRDYANGLSKRISENEGDIKDLKKFRDTITELRMEKDKLYKKFAEEESRFLEGLEILKMNIRKRMEKMMEKYHEQFVRMQEFASPKTIESSVKDVMLALFENRLQEIEKRIMLLDQKAKALNEKDRDIIGMIEETEAPENLRKWLDVKTKDVERRFYYDIQGLKKEAEKAADATASMKERQKSYDSMLAEFSKKMTEQATTMNRVIDVRDIFAKRAESLNAAMKSVDAKIAAERERTLVLEQNLREAENRFDRISEDMESVKRIVSDVKPLKQKLAESDASVKFVQKRLADKEALALQVRKMEGELSSMREKQSALESQMAADKARLETFLHQMMSERRGVEDKVKREKVKVNELLRELKP